MPLLLEPQGIAYTGSAPFALSLALHKHKAKDVLRGARRPHARGAASLATPRTWTAVALPFPLIVKPSREDASVGITSRLGGARPRRARPAA